MAYLYEKSKRLGPMEPLGGPVDNGAKILIVGPCGGSHGVVRMAVADLTATIVWVDDSGAAFSALLDETFDLAIIDASVGDGALENLIYALRPNDVHLPVLVVTSGAAAPPLLVLADAFVSCDVEASWLHLRLKYHLETRQKFLALQLQITALDKANRTDAPTGLANRTAFDERLRDEFQRAQRYDDALALILIEIDQWKVFVDRFGRMAAEAALRSFGHAIVSAVREVDFVARFGPEEFAAILPKTHLGGGLTVAGRIFHMLRQLRVGPAQIIHLSASMGVSAYPSASVTSFSEFFRSAENALVRSKNTGRDRISVYDAVPRLVVA